MSKLPAYCPLCDEREIDPSNTKICKHCMDWIVKRIMAEISWKISNY